MKTDDHVVEVNGMAFQIGKVMTPDGPKWSLSKWDRKDGDWDRPSLHNSLRLAWESIFHRAF